MCNTENLSGGLKKKRTGDDDPDRHKRVSLGSTVQIHKQSSQQGDDDGGCMA